MSSASPSTDSSEFNDLAARFSSVPGPQITHPYIGDIALVSTTSMFEQKVRRLLVGDQAPRIVAWPLNRAEPGASGVAVALLGPDLTAESAVAMAAAIDREHPEVCIVLVAERSPDLFEQALRAGARDVISPSISPKALADAIDRAIENSSRRLSQRAPAPSVGHGGKRLFTVMSPKGGVGKTFVATNLAVALARLTPHDVALVDLDLQFGDVAASLHLMPEHTFIQATRSALAREAAMLKVFLAPHESGLYAMCAPDDPAEADEITDDKSIEIIRQLASSFGTVIVDTAAGLDAHTLASAEISTDLLFVCSVDVASVRALRREIEALDRLGMTYQQRHLVLNRANASGGARPEDVETAIGLKASLQLPTDPLVLTAANQGLPMVRSDPKSAIARRFIAYADVLAEVEGPKRKDRDHKPGLSLPWRRSK